MTSHHRSRKRLAGLPRLFWLLVVLGVGIGIWWFAVRTPRMPEPMSVQATPLALPGTPIPLSGAVLSADRAGQIALLARWGRGYAGDAGVHA